MSYGAQRFSFGYHLTPWVKRLLIANTVVFLITWIAGPAFFVDWFAFAPADAFRRPWGVVTYMFLHGDVWHLLVNMLILFFFGPPLENRWGSSEFLKYYALCGMGGVALSFIFAPGSAIIGASAAIYGLMLAFAWYWPESPIYIWGIFPVKAKWLVGFFFLMAFISAFQGPQDGVAHFAHLGGLLTGVAYLKFGNSLATRFGDVGRSARSERFAIVPRKEAREAQSGKKASRRPEKSRRREKELLDQVDHILDKISARGIGSLTDEERKILDEVSKKRRTN